MRPIKLSSNKIINSVSIYTVYGQELKKDFYRDLELSIGLTDLSAGIYFIKISETTVRLSV